jgi:hypothetical protein
MTLARTAVFCSLVAVIPGLACAEEMAPVALNSLSTAPSGIASARVLDQQGRVLGQVERVQTDHDGKPAAVAFRAADGRGTIVLAAASLSYDGKELVAASDQPQLAMLESPQLRTAAAQ